MRLWYLPAVGCDSAWSPNYTKRTNIPVQTHTVCRQAWRHTLVLCFCGGSVSLYTLPSMPNPVPPLYTVFCMVLFWRVAQKTDSSSLSLFSLLGFLPSLPFFFFTMLIFYSFGCHPCPCGWPFLQPLPIMVVPPARAALDPWVKSSTVVVPRYGIWKWVWMSMPPGITIFPWASMVFTPPGTIRLSPICLWKGRRCCCNCAMIWWCIHKRCSHSRK